MQRLFTVSVPATFCRRIKAASLEEAYSLLAKWIDEHPVALVGKASWVTPAEPSALAAKSSRPSPPREDFAPLPIDGKTAAAGTL
jgi:hypothetical protein